MKKIFLLLTIASMAVFTSCNSGSEAKTETETEAISDGHNSQNSLDWAGIYQGTLPCADCAGIKTTLELKNDNTYTLTQEYIDRDTFNENGTFGWDADGSVITLSSNGQKYKVGENILFALDQDGNVVTGDLAENYKLKKNVD
ncbi:MAG: copper resistance protein NlpE N-terminal domain-containing protein [Chitinophagaceae bacterium]|nr:copper resistance protein NlpE N-terminal domain-containing protein [Chitinophagaceae bacterium]